MYRLTNRVDPDDVQQNETSHESAWYVEVFIYVYDLPSQV